MNLIKEARTEEQAPMLSVWKTLSPLVARLMVERPVLAQRLTLSPRCAIHGIAIFIYWAMLQEYALGQIADAIATTDVRGLLKQAIPDGHPRLYGALRRVGPTVRPRSFYADLNAVLHGPAADLVLDASEIDDSVLIVAKAVIDDPVLLAARHAIGSSPRSLSNLSSILAILRAHGIADSIGRLPDRSGWQAILRRIEQDIARAHAPVAPFSAPEGWRIVSDMATLFQIGERLSNCVASVSADGLRYLRSFLNGSLVFLEGEDPLILVSVESVGPGLWTLSDIQRQDGSWTPSATREFKAALSQSIGQSNNRLVEVEPFFALSQILQRSQQSDDDRLFDLSDLVDEEI